MPQLRLFFLLSGWLILQVSPLLAQDAGLTIQGQVISTQTRQAMEYVTVLAVDPVTNQTLSGTNTDKDGKFQLQLSQAAFVLRLSFIGYQNLELKEFTIEERQVNLGKIAMVEASVSLDEVTIEGEQSSTSFELDKRVFNVGKDLSSTGASALEVLNNVPSVNVNIEGQISLRGSQGVQILIDGKPSVIASDEGNALGTITAEMIDRIEVITNPSAKYDAEGTSGIINIVLKKEEKKGLNGSFSLNTGIPHNHSFGLSLNRRTQKFNLFSQLGVGYRELPRQTRNINENLLTGTIISSVGEEFRNENFYNFILGTDYHIDDFNVLTLSGSFAYEIEDQPSETTFQLLGDNDTVLSEWRRQEVTEALNPKFQYELQYKRDFKDHKEHDLLFSALGNFFGKDQRSQFQNTTLSGENFDGLQETRTAFQEAKYTFKLDYTRPFDDKWSIETGAQYVLQNVSNDFSVSNFINNDWIVDPDLTNIFEYVQNVLGVYGTGAYEGKKWGIKLGLRAENTDLTTLLINTNEGNDQNFTNLFPSAATSYKLSEKVSLQASYSRRIYRPRLWDLNPFFNPRNSFSIRAGNPNLMPEFTDSYELNSIFAFNNLSFNTGIYHRFTTEVIERVSFFEDNVNIVTPINLGTNQATGLELNAKYNPAKWVTLNGDANFLYFSRLGTFQSTSFDFSASQWSGKLTGKFKLPAKIDFEVTTRYESAIQRVQGIRSAILSADMGLRKKILKGRGVLNFSIRDIFASRIQETTTIQPDFELYRRDLRGRFITCGFSYGFGKGEAMEFSGARRRY
ncbi:MAG: TonB-dependent receptor [Bacteroidota bacterium]